jgi:hypothetical protein
MRFKILLPVLQMTAMLLIVWTPWNPQAHQLDVLAANGSESKMWALIPGPPAIDWAEGINLPASAVVTPIEFAIRKANALPNYQVRFCGLWVVGLLCWYMVGRFVDDLVRWRHNRKLPGKHAVDLTFALIAAPSAALLAIAFNEGDTRVPIIGVWGVIWVVIACAALLFRVAQAIQQRRRPAVPRNVS